MASFEASPNPSAVTIAGGAADSNSNMNDPKPKKTNRGRIKIAIEKIQNKNKKHVTFSKRRKGLFKKASELCVLCGVSVAIVTISEAGKVFTFGHPSADAVVYRYLHGGDGAPSSTPPAIVAGAAQCKHEYCSGGAMSWWDRPVEELGLEELESYAASLEQIRSDVERRITDLDLEYQSRSKAAVRIEFDRDLRLNQPGMVAIGNQMDNYYNMNGVGGVDPAISFVSPDFHALPCQDRDVQYSNQYFGCMGGDYDDINSIVAMANFNRSNRGFAEFGEV